MADILQTEFSIIFCSVNWCISFKILVEFVCQTIQLTYCKLSNISHTKSPNLNVSPIVLQLSLPNPMKPAVKSRMKM